MWRIICFVALGGAIGSVLRFLTTALVHKYWQASFPLATFIINGVGCFCIGLFAVLLQKQNFLSEDLKWFLITGLCGGYTTFSAFGLENFTLLQNHNVAISLLYIGGSIFTGIAFVWFGMIVGKIF